MRSYTSHLQNLAFLNKDYIERKFKNVKVALVHDDLVQWGGAEKVLLAISEVFPDSWIYTSVFDKSNQNLVKHFKHKKIVTSFLQKIPFWRNLYRPLLPLYPIAFEQFDFSEFDLVISQTTKFAKCVITKPETKHICYCHTPPRFLWGFSGQRVNNFLQSYFSILRRFDLVFAKRVDTFLAGSRNCQERIKKVYGTPSKVLLPFVDLDIFKPSEAFDGGYYLIIARLNGYKRVDLAVKAFNQNGKRLRVVGLGPESSKLQSIAKANVEFLGGVGDEMLVKLILGCKALLVTGEEDFGMTPLEAQAAGKGVIAYKKGGVLETVIENKTGVFFNEQTPVSLNEAIEKFEEINIDNNDCRRNAEKFSKVAFKKNLVSLI